MEFKITSLKDHFILCGLGRVGMQIALELRAAKQPFVVIDRQDKSELCKKHNFLFIQGDAAKGKEAFAKAKIERAKGVIIAIGIDMDSLYMVIEAKSQNPKIYIMARASSEEGMNKLQEVGAHRVSMPHIVGAKHMAETVLSDKKIS